MRIENGKIVLEKRECSSCRGSRTVSEWVPCKACNGTGKRDPLKPNGRNCLTCGKHSSYAKGKVLQDGFPCRSCTDGTQDETLYDYAPKELWEGLEYRVFRSNRHQTIGEYLLGHDCAYSVTDYGAHKHLTDEALIAKVRSNGANQAIKFAQKDGTVCTFMGIFCNDNGYSVKAVFEGDGMAVQADLARGLDVETGFAVGSQLAAEGLNGTMLVADFKRPKK